jgi:hypothetical protein
MLGFVGLTAGAMLAMVLLLVSGGTTGEYHVGAQLFCYDCHTMHYSMSHQWGSGDPVVAATPAPGGNWLGGTGPNEKLLKLPVNDLCASCHNGQAFAPDVVEVNANPIANPGGRSAGALNTKTSVAPYEIWKGHTLGSAAAPPGYKPDLVGLTDPYPAGSELECVNCHAAHGSKPSYRNLGPRAFSTAAATIANFRPTYVIAAANDTTKDVWINAPGYTTASSNAATFNPYYATQNIRFNKLADGTKVGSLTTSNRLGSFCAACHANFHGGEDAGSGVWSGTDFIRHPTSGVTVPSRYKNGAAATQPHPGPPLPDAKVRIFGDDTTGSPGCVTCHKGHGNQNPFGLIFLNQLATNVTEEGGFAPDQAVQDAGTGLRNLCWQCHGMGASDAGY